MKKFPFFTTFTTALLLVAAYFDYSPAPPVRSHEETINLIKSGKAIDRNYFPIRERESNSWKLYIFLAAIFGASAIAQLASKDESEPPSA